jgi:hypothetical protein
MINFGSAIAEFLAWFHQLPSDAQATLVVAVISAIVSFFGIIVKRIFDSLSERSDARIKVFHTMFEKVHPLIMSSYNELLGNLSDLANSTEYYLELSNRSPDLRKVKEQAQIVFHHYALHLKSLMIDEPLFLRDYEAEIAQGLLAELVNPYFFDSKGRWSILFGAVERSTIQKSITSSLSLVDFNTICKRQQKMAAMAAKFFDWLVGSDKIYLQRYVLWTRAYSNLIHYHWDLLYESWYRAKPPWMDNESKKCVRTLVPQYGCSRVHRSLIGLLGRFGVNLKHDKIRSYQEVLYDLGEEIIAHGLVNEDHIRPNAM